MELPLLEDTGILTLAPLARCFSVATWYSIELKKAYLVNTGSRKMSTEV